MQNIVQEILKELTNSRHNSKGAKPAFTSLDLFVCFWTISERKNSRASLSSTLGLGEGTVRTMISILTDLGWIVTNNSGCSLSEKGMTKKKELETMIKRIVYLKKQNSLTFNLPSCAIVLSKCKHLIGNGVAQRDSAIKSGAEGATTLVIQNGRLTFPDVPGQSDFQKGLDEIALEIGDFENDDVVILSYSKEQKFAKRGCFAACLSLLDLQSY